MSLVAAGHAYASIADNAGVSVSTVKRQIGRALAERPPEPVETFVALQRERLNKALQYADLALERGDLRAVAALLALLPQVERYWGLQTALRAAAGVRVLAPNPLTSLETATGLTPAAEPLASSAVERGP